MGTYFTASSYTVTSGNIVYADDLNDPLTSIDTGLTSLIGHIRVGTPLTSAADTGSANTYAMALTPALTSYDTGLEVSLKPANTNTGGSTLNINSLGAKTIKRFGLEDLEAGDLLANYYVKLKYDGAYFQIVSTAGSAEAAAASNATAAAASAAAALVSENAAAASAATIDLPAISGSTALDGLRVNAAKDGYEFAQFYTETEVDALLVSAKSPVVSGVDVTGELDGLELEYVDASSIKFNAGGCLDSTRTAQIDASDMTKAITASSAWVAGASGNCLLMNAVIATNEYYDAYALLKDSDDSVDFGLLENGNAIGSNLPVGYSKYRWIGFARFNGSDEVCEFVQVKDLLEFVEPDDNRIATVSVLTTGNATTKDHSAFFPESRIESVLYGAGYEGSNGVLYSTLDKAIEEMRHGSTNSTLGWRLDGSGDAFFVPYSSSLRYFYSTTASTYLLCQAVRMKR